ncbi:Transmembrane emp24 domain-containing protein 7 [Anabarilius grahami]|uniref:Transmembrane emp24 domain-containing protein 7 n=1 Tax=Anabarilius grahami TaxID=495550 RepID=A0A3N0Z5K7_ANAGA|nr:Transmembrane emp24 domain-containing protein 7 [Anabarilius grahami]
MWDGSVCQQNQYARNLEPLRTGIQSRIDSITISVQMKHQGLLGHNLTVSVCVKMWSGFLLLPLVFGWICASELTFELPDNAKQCFYEDIIIGTKCTLEFQVVTGGHYDVDCRLEDPDGTVLYKEMKKQYDSFTFTASRNGTYKFCFSNEFSTFTHKTVYFDFQVGDDPPLFPNENRVTALTQMESACVSIHEALKSVIDYQTHFRLREAQGRSRAEDLNTRVAFWSIGEAFILLVVSISQVVLLRSFFSDKKTTTTRVGS